MAVIALFVGLALFSAPVRAQIRPWVDPSGKRIFVNAEEPGTRRSAVPARNGGQGFAGGVPRSTKSPANASPANRRPARLSQKGLEQLVHETSERHQVDPALVRAVISAESNWNPSAVSRKGAQGLMQLIPGTAERLGVGDVFNPQQNLDGGVRYLRMLLERYDGDLHRALAAYNAGEGAVDRARGVPNYRETRSYVQKVTNTYFQSDSGRFPNWWTAPRSIRRTTDERGRMIFTNE